MIDRKKKLRITQLILLILGIVIIIFTYYINDNSSKNEIVSKVKQEEIKDLSQDNDKNIFYNIEYSGLDLNGNRYRLKSQEAFTKKDKEDIVYMKFVEAIFYFKDNTVLSVESNEGVYNNRTLDMSFEGKVNASYEKSKLKAENAVYSNSEGFLTISNNVIINDIRGTMVADELLFDIKTQTLNIASFNDGKINANINMK